MEEPGTSLTLQKLTVSSPLSDIRHAFKVCLWGLPWPYCAVMRVYILCLPVWNQQANFPLPPSAAGNISLFSLQWLCEKQHAAVAMEILDSVSAWDISSVLSIYPMHIHPVPAQMIVKILSCCCSDAWSMTLRGRDGCKEQSVGSSKLQQALQCYHW